MKEAAATSILSPGWRYLLTSIPVINLVFNDTSDELDPIQRENSHLKFSRYIDFCINLIRQRNTAPIRKFGLTIFPPWLCERFQLQMDSLISALPLCNVQELEIFLFENDAERSNLLGIFTCKTLVVLKMDRQVDLDIPNSVALPDLKVLRLECLSMVGKDSLDMLIRGCPLLEELYLDIVESPTYLSHELAVLEIFRYKTLVSLRLGWQISLFA
ncbi:putative F-box/LRR-repeat protein At3g58880 [Coffea arabica]|uniref:F-box/LRR-repeat protein At3g58880 n=1 Tax=Coffea arabica TaxID=13443 RepID=A0A6P6SC29_COFAR